MLAEVHMTTRIRGLVLVGFLGLLFAFVLGVAAQTPPVQEKPAPQVKTVTSRAIPSVDGEQNYIEYCAVCHGKDGKGHGPAAPAMKAAVPDLTTYAQRHGGKFNRLAVQYIILGTEKLPTPAHGVEDMPIWGEVFRGRDPSVTKLRIGNLVSYLESIQKGGTED